MAFKMKGHTLPGINQRSEGNTDLPDGRSGSSPFQESSPAKQKRAPKPVKPGEKPIAVKNIPWEFEYKDAIDAFRKKKSDTTKTKEKKKSPAKCPLVAALPMIAKIAGGVSAVSGMMKKKKEE